MSDYPPNGVHYTLMRNTGEVLLHWPEESAWFKCRSENAAERFMRLQGFVATRKIL